MFSLSYLHYGLSYNLAALHLLVPSPVQDPLQLPVQVVDGSRDLLGNPAEVAVGLELHVAFVARGVVDHLHLPHLVDPELPYHDVVNDGLDLPPAVVIPRLGELEMGDSQRFNLQILPYVEVIIIILDI